MVGKGSSSSGGKMVGGLFVPNASPLLSPGITLGTEVSFAVGTDPRSGKPVANDVWVLSPGTIKVAQPRDKRGGEVEVDLTKVPSGIVLLEPANATVAEVSSGGRASGSWGRGGEEKSAAVAAGGGGGQRQKRISG